MSDSPFQMLLLSPSDEHGAATIVLNNPTRRNAIGQRMVNELLHALEKLEKDDAVRSIVLTGAGKAFCGGGDLAQMTGGSDDAPELAHKGDYADLLLALTRCSKPVIARVNGHAMGGGLGLVAACHFAVAQSEAKLGTPEINVGLFPMMIMAVLRRHMSYRRLSQMMLFGERLVAADACELGLLNAVTEADNLDAEVAKISATIATKSPITVRLGLEAMAAQADLALEDALALLRQRLGACLATEDAREGLMAFLEKRKPHWQGK